MEKTSPEATSFTICARCPLNKPLCNQDRSVREIAGETVRRINEKFEATDQKTPLYSRVPEFVLEAARESGGEDMAQEAWFCSRIRRLGTCSSIEVLFPDEQYL